MIGVGNEFRRDDGLGPEVLSRLRDQVTADTGGDQAGDRAGEQAGCASWPATASRPG